MKKHIKKHVKRHKKKYTKFILFFLLLTSFSVVEDIMAFSITGMERMNVVFQVENLVLIIVVAMAFTIVSELVDELFPHSEKPLLGIIRRERKYIKRKFR